MPGESTKQKRDTQNPSTPPAPDPRQNREDEQFGSLDRRDDEKGSQTPEKPAVQPPQIRGDYGRQPFGKGAYKPDSREGGEWRDEGQGQTSGQLSTSGHQSATTNLQPDKPTTTRQGTRGQVPDKTPDPGPGPHGSFDPETEDRNKNKPLTDDWGKGDKH